MSEGGVGPTEKEGAGRVCSCVDCGSLTCARRTGSYPDFCLTEGLTERERANIVKLYTSDEQVRAAAIASAEVEGDFYGRYTRVEETMEFARRIGANKIGIAGCAGLARETRTFAKILRHKGFEVYGVFCKVGAVDKTEIGINEKYMQLTGCSMCNPILQAKLLNKQKTQLNVVIGLCVGHDSLFMKYAKALCTTLVVKDRVLAHNPVGALYQAEAYYSRLLKD